MHGQGNRHGNSEAARKRVGTFSVQRHLRGVYDGGRRGPPAATRTSPMTDHQETLQPDIRLKWIVPATVVLAVATFALYALPVSPDSLVLLKEVLLLVAFALPLWPLSQARAASDGEHRVAWLLLLAGAAAGLAGQIVWIIYRLAVGTGASFAAAELGYVTFMVFTTVALALGVSSNGRRGVRAELVIDLLLIGTIGLFLVQEIFSLLPESHTVNEFELAMGGINLIAALALGVAALGALISPGAMGGGVPKLLVVFSGFIAAVARSIFAYNHFFGQDTSWLIPAWIFSLLMIAAAATERALNPGDPDERTGMSGSPLRTLVVPMIVAYGLSLLIREILGAGSPGGPNTGMGWAFLALLIVARVATAILSSERRAAELTAWERRYETLVNTMGSLVYEWNPVSDRVVRSGAIEQIFGGEAANVSESIDATLQLMHQEDRVKAEHGFREAIKHEGLFEIEYRLRQADGAWILIRDRGFCDHDADGKPSRVLGIMSDITNEREGEDRLRRAERLASLGGLAAGAAHEINNPLAAISLAAQMLIEDDRLPEDVLDDVRIIERQASRAGEVTDRMLVFARRKEGERDTYDINDLLREVVRGRRYEVETRGITLQENPADDLPLVFVDPVQIERVLTNLLVNAEKALQDVPEGERLLMVTTRSTETGVAVDIADTGPGISEHVLPNIFDPFFTTREVGEGTGLGLSMSHSIVQAHRGELKVQTRPGEGTTFTLELPRAPEGMDESEKTIGGTRRAPDFVIKEDLAARPLRILMVDDEDEIRDLARRFLTGKGHSVDEAATGREALKLVTANDYDGIVLDLRMPDLSGEGFFEWVRKNRPQMASKITVISGDLANPQTVQILVQDLLRHIEENAAT